MSRRDAAAMLDRALVADADRCGIAIRVVDMRSRRWASATFVGARHHIRIDLCVGDAAETWLAGLGEADLPLRGHLVADLIVIAQTAAADRITAEIEALTVEEA